MCVTDNNLNGLMALTLKCISEVYQDASFFFFRIGLHEVASIETLHGVFFGSGENGSREHCIKRQRSREQKKL